MDCLCSAISIFCSVNVFDLKHMDEPTETKRPRERDTALSQAVSRRVTVHHVSGGVLPVDCPPLGLHFCHGKPVPKVPGILVRS